MAMAVYLLGGDAASVDTEDVAIKVNELAPGIFVWRKYRDQINLKLIEAFLYDAKKPRCGELLVGTTRQGWRLSAKGIDWINKQGNELLSDAGIQYIKDKGHAGTDPVRKDRERRRLYASDGWSSWESTKSLSKQDARQLFRVNDYTTKEMIENKVVRFKSLFFDEPELEEFVSAAARLLLGEEDV